MSSRSLFVPIYIPLTKKPLGWERLRKSLSSDPVYQSSINITYRQCKNSLRMVPSQLYHPFATLFKPSDPFEGTTAGFCQPAWYCYLITVAWFNDFLENFSQEQVFLVHSEPCLTLIVTLQTFVYQKNSLMTGTMSLLPVKLSIFCTNEVSITDSHLHWSYCVGNENIA